MRYTRDIIPGYALAMVEKAEALIENENLVIPHTVEDVKSFQPPVL